MSNHPPLFLPCLRGQMGDWAYYSTLMPLSEVKLRIRPAQEIHKSDTLCEMIQRSISNRKKDISDYILKQPQHLFNSIIVGIYEGDPQWYQMEMPSDTADNGTNIPVSLAEKIGALCLNGSEKIFALDGQHRVEGIKGALDKKPQLKEEQLSVIFVAHNNSASGLQRSRRLFATLNRYAKPVSKLEIIALDEDDPVAIITRMLLRDHPTLSKDGVIATPKGKAMPSSNSLALTTAVALYEGLLGYFCSIKDLKGKTLKDFLANRPGNSDLKKMFKDSKELIDQTIVSFSSLHSYSKLSSKRASKLELRSPKGGHLLFRPVGFLAYMQALGTAVSRGHSLTDTVQSIAEHCEMQIEKFPWSEVIFNEDTGTMTANSGKGAIKNYSTLILKLSRLSHLTSELEKSKLKQHLIEIGHGSRQTLSPEFKRIVEG